MTRFSPQPDATRAAWPGVAEATAVARSILPLLIRFRSLLALLVLVVFLSLATDSFWSEQNLQNVLRQISVNLCLAVGMTLVVLTGGIDLSVGSTLALAAAVTAGLQALRDHAVDALEGIEVDGAGLRVPGDLSGCRGRATHQPLDVVADGPKVRHEGGTDQAGRTGDCNSHVDSIPHRRLVGTSAVRERLRPGRPGARA